MLLIFEREVEITVEGEPYHLTPGMVIVMPANIPPVVHALIQFKMMLW
jgi:quercetin dioxygenase-like cupin family protein